MAALMTFDKFKEFVSNLIRDIAGQGDEKFNQYKAERDAREAALQAKADEASSRAETLNAKVSELMSALASKDEQLINATSLAAQQLSTDLNNFTTELANEFLTPKPPVNPTPITDIAVQATVNEPAIDTTAIEQMPEATAVGEPEATPAPVLEATVEAIVEAAPAE